MNFAPWCIVGGFLLPVLPLVRLEKWWHTNIMETQHSHSDGASARTLAKILLKLFVYHVYNQEMFDRL